MDGSSNNDVVEVIRLDECTVDESYCSEEASRFDVESREDMDDSPIEDMEPLFEMEGEMNESTDAMVESEEGSAPSEDTRDQSEGSGCQSRRQLNGLIAALMMLLLISLRGLHRDHSS